MSQTPDIVERIQARVERLTKQNASCQIICDLLAPEVAKFDARTGHDIYTVRMAVDHASSIRTQAKEIADWTEAADTIIHLTRELGDARDAEAAEIAAWLRSNPRNFSTLGKCIFDSAADSIAHHEHRKD